MIRAETGKIETVGRDVKDDQGQKHTMPFLKLSLYVDPMDFPDALSFNGATLYLSRTSEDGSGSSISPELRGRLLGIGKALVAVLEEE